MKKALVTGITGQDGSYLAELLLSKGYEVHGIRRRSSSFNTARIEHLLDGESDGTLKLHYGDMTDTTSINNVIDAVKPDEVYNLAAQSHVAVSFEMPEYTADVDAMGTLRVLEAIRRFSPKTKFYQAGTSELYGSVQEVPQRETTPFYPRSPYAVAKLYSHWITINYREAYNIFAVNGILFNHESPRRGEIFVTRKITRAINNIIAGKQAILKLGNLDSKRDWGHAKDYVEMQWRMLQVEKPQDFVISTGVQYSVRDFISKCCNYKDLILTWYGSGLDEVGTIEQNNKIIGKIVVDSKYFRPSEVDTLLGDASKARKILGWSPTITIDELVAEMMESDSK